MNRLLALLVVLGVTSPASAEVVFTNLNSSGSAATATGFTNYAQRFTTVSAGSGFQVDLNLISSTGPQTYAVELWSADGTGGNVSALLAAIGSGSVSSTDKTAVYTFNSAYSLEASTNYFIKLVVESGTFGVVLGPSSSTVLNSVVRYGVGALPFTDPNSAIGMKVDVVAVPEPAGTGLAGLAAATVAAAALGRRPVSLRQRG